MNFRIIQIVSIVAGLFGWLQTARAQLSAPLQQVLDSEFTTIVSIKDLPVGVRRRLPHGIANPHEPFDATDVPTGNASRRLIVAGHSSKRDFVCYEQGGFGYHLHLVIFSSGTIITHRLFEGYILKESEDAATVADIKSLIQSGEVRDATTEWKKHPD
jgi:hypothetical protein